MAHAHKFKWNERQAFDRATSRGPDHAACTYMRRDDGPQMLGRLLRIGS